MDLDATDTAILRFLQRDARASLRTIAKGIGVSVPTVSARLRNLEQLGIVRGYRAVLDPGRLEEVAFALVIRARPSAAQEVARKVAEALWARRVLTGRSGRILVDATVLHPNEMESVVKHVSTIPGVLGVEAYSDLTPPNDDPVAFLSEHPSASVVCFECKGPIHGEPVKARRDGRYHYFCCHTCERLYLERYDRIRAAGRPRR